MQKLILPFKKSMNLCGFKNANYLGYWKYSHYGLDISTIQGGAGTDPNIYGSGAGVVKAVGYDTSVGNTVIVVYDDVYIHGTGKTQSLTARYAHMASTSVAVGDKVTTSTVLGVEGNTQTGDHHLHIEFDTDTQYYQYSPQVSSADDKLTAAQGNIWMKGTDSCVDPSLVWYQTGDRVLVTPTYAPSWLNSTDFSVPVLKTDTSDSVFSKEEYDEVVVELAKANSTIESVKLLINESLKLLE